jgi:hypothetical protein
VQAADFGGDGRASTGPVVSTVISGPMPTGRSYLSIVASVAVVSQWTSCLGRAL